MQPQVYGCVDETILMRMLANTAGASSFRASCNVSTCVHVSLSQSGEIYVRLIIQALSDLLSTWAGSNARVLYYLVELTDNIVRKILGTKSPALVPI